MIGSLFLAERSKIEKRLFLCGRIAQYRGLGSRGFLSCMFRSFQHFFVLIVFSSLPPLIPRINVSNNFLFMSKLSALMKVSCFCFLRKFLYFITICLVIA